uniref:Putative LRR receptor-like serine/threonine-protein kinase At5g45840 n=1 Tax=Anthurium amnicola TaxID=1678845 RepID=A0A1D1ZKL2_9ARAE
MEGLGLGRRLVWLLLMSLLLWSVGSCAFLNDEGRALLRFRERVEVDPYAALSDWVAGEDTDDPCSWSRIECEDGKVTVLNLKDLCIKGTLAPELGTLFHLKSLILHNNSFYGIIPREFGILQKLEILDLGYNNLSGPIPSDLGNILSLEFLMMRGNQFLGSMPSKLYDLSMLSELEVDGNLPSSNGKSLTRVDGNATIRRILQLDNGGQGKSKKLTGPPAASPSSPPPSSDSQNPDSLPPTPLKNVPSPSREPNSGTKAPAHKLAPPPAAKKNRTSGVPPSPSVTNPRSSGSPPPKASQPKKMFILVGVGTLSLVGALVFCVLCYQCNKVVTVKPWTTGLSGQLQKAFVTGVPQLKRSELETACEDFSNIIGSLSDCMLYKGTLSSGVEIAVASTHVTSAKDWSKHSEALFRKKIATLSKVNHKNFVNLLGYCEQEEPFTRIMVFEYAPNGTLFEHLHVKEAEELDWAARLRISMGIAYCLDQMHQLQGPVVLRNLQSSSIYLTDDFAAKVSDFEFWSQTTVVETVSAGSGPLDKNAPNSDSIVYKFGILLLEIISGRPPYSDEKGLLLDWASDYLQGSKPLSGVVDPNIVLSHEDDVGAFLEVIRHCCNPVPQARPTIKEVTSRLREITAVSPDGASPKLSPLWWAELEILSTEMN